MVGRLCDLGIDFFPSSSNAQGARQLSPKSSLPIVKCLTELLVTLQTTDTAFGVPLLLAIEKKIALNEKKHPVQLCQVSVPIAILFLAVALVIITDVSPASLIFGIPPFLSLPNS